jgi:serine O-acetyltransferase
LRIEPGRIWYWSTRAHRRGHSLVARLLKLLNFMLFRSLLPFEADVAPDVRLEHYGLCTVIHPNVTVGANVRIFHHVTLAAESVIGSPHRIVIEEGVTIGAGAVVTGDVAPGARVVGSPAKAIGRRPAERGAVS